MSSLFQYVVISKNEDGTDGNEWGPFSTIGEAEAFRADMIDSSILVEYEYEYADQNLIRDVGER